jgi:hypothetical protein
MIGFMLMNLNFESLLLFGLTSLTIHTDPFQKRMKSDTRVKSSMIPIKDCNTMMFTTKAVPPIELIDPLKHMEAMFR